MAKAKKSVPASRPTRFFSKELKGEAPLSLETAWHLFLLASKVYGRSPWKFLLEDHLIFCPMNDPQQLAILSIMGARGEFFSVMVYFGGEGYELFRQMSEADDDADPVEFYTQRSSVHVEYHQSSQLDAPDKALLRAFGHPATKALYGPAFRASRPGYMPWYINEQEGRTLGHALAALLVFLDHLREGVKTNPWANQRLYPAVVLESDWKEEAIKATFTTMAPPPAPKPVVELPTLDSLKIQRVIDAGFRRGGLWEIDNTPTRIPVGNNERRFFARCCMLTDSSGAILDVELLEPVAKAGDALVTTILRQIEKRCAVPTAIRVMRPEYAKMLAALSVALKIPVQVVLDLPNVRQARDGMLEFLARGR